MILAEGSRVRLRQIERADLEGAAGFQYTLSILEPLTHLARLTDVFDQTGFWTDDAGAVAIEAGGRLVGTMQFYRAGMGLHGYEIGYIIHAEADRGKGYASEAVRLFGDHLFAQRPACHRLQLIIETWNEASARLAEACGYQREGTLRKGGYSDAADPPDVWVYSRVR
ncbi:GNAT family protein [Phenylobacterium sp.]|uniref:GNAT family N-acetyltransferase n=1 Tax=Phenylobacterium sp. TaxID=1871053 RepID=UPI002DF5AC7A|nr:GNAT family protein [Phenylobacterium sp.]